MQPWTRIFRADPIQPLLASGNTAVEYFVRRDLLDEQVGSPQSIWQTSAVQRILKKQLPDGSWPRTAPTKHPAVNVALIETWRQFRHLVQQVELTREHPQVQQAAEFLFSCQTPAGDFRGFLANQYATYYTGAIMGLLIQAGYEQDPRIEKGFQWLLGMRQDDQGWTIPILTHPLDRATLYRVTSEFAPPLEPDRSKPFSHNWTGMVLRAFAAHPKYRKSEAARAAACLLMSRFFQPDSYTSYHAASYWVRFEYPYWWNQLVAALDSITRIGGPWDDGPINRALDWFADHQQDDGLWKTSYAEPEGREKNTTDAREKKLWVSLSICRVIKRLVEMVPGE